MLIYVEQCVLYSYKHAAYSFLAHSLLLLDNIAKWSILYMPIACKICDRLSLVIKNITFTYLYCCLYSLLLKSGDTYVTMCNISKLKKNE